VSLLFFPDQLLADSYSAVCPYGSGSYGGGCNSSAIQNNAGNTASGSANTVTPSSVATAPASANITNGKPGGSGPVSPGNGNKAPYFIIAAMFLGSGLLFLFALKRRFGKKGASQINSYPASPTNP
jgi:hypothetical protein